MSNIKWDSVVNIKTQEDIDSEIRYHDAKNYLNSTDWYVFRLIETGKDIPNDIKIGREKARSIVE